MKVSTTMKKLSFVIPCYRSEKTIQTVVRDIDNVLAAMNYRYEIVLVNDNSPDNVWSVIAELCEQRENIIGINFAKNFGQHSAIMAGFRQVSGDFVFTLDDDGQTPADEIPKLLAKCDEGYDVVFGEYAERKDNAFRKFGSKANNYMLENIVGKPADVHLTSFYVARKFVIEEICKYHNPYPYLWGLIVRTTSNIANVTIRHNNREEGSSGYTLTKLIRLWLNGFTAFSVKPLRIATAFGGIISVLGFVYAIFTIINRLLHPEIAAGFSSLMSAILIIGGMIMILLGMLGEYIGRIYICINESPQYVVKEIKNMKVFSREK